MSHSSEYAWFITIFILKFIYRCSINSTLLKLRDAGERALQYVLGGHIHIHEFEYVHEYIIDSYVSYNNYYIQYIHIHIGIAFIIYAILLFISISVFGTKCHTPLSSVKIAHIWNRIKKKYLLFYKFLFACWCAKNVCNSDEGSLGGLVTNTFNYNCTHQHAQS